MYNRRNDAKEVRNKMPFSELANINTFVTFFMNSVSACFDNGSNCRVRTFQNSNSAKGNSLTEHDVWTAGAARTRFDTSCIVVIQFNACVSNDCTKAGSCADTAGWATSTGSDREKMRGMGLAVLSVVVVEAVGGGVVVGAVVVVAVVVAVARAVAVVAMEEALLEAWWFVVVVVVVVVDGDESFGRPTGVCLVLLDRGGLDGVEPAVAPPGRFSLLSS
jgi:hypothetical protein